MHGTTQGSSLSLEEIQNNFRSARDAAIKKFEEESETHKTEERSLRSVISADIVSLAETSRSYLLSNAYVETLPELYRQDHIESVTYIFGQALEHNSNLKVFEALSLLTGEIRTLALMKCLAANNYLTPLMIRYKQLVHKDFYGDVVTDSADAELFRFIKTRKQKLIAGVDQVNDREAADGVRLLDVFTAFGERHKTFFNDAGLRTYLSYHSSGEISSDSQEETLSVELQYIVTTLLAASEEAEDDAYYAGDVDGAETLTPLDYEEAVANFLNSELGWQTYRTKSSGDQGADVVAETDKAKIVIQCKYYTGSVGNSAVQEVHAARGFYQADFAVVVTNSRFTVSARQLADSLGVVLLHHDQLSELNDLLSV